MLPKFIDSHCHIQLPQYDQDRDEVIQRAREAGVLMICVGTDFETSRQGIDIANENEGVWASIGLHPNDNLNEDFDASSYEELMTNECVVALGEIGLDYYRTTDEGDKKFQRERFQEQLDLAVRKEMPVILHSRDAGKGSVGIVHPDLLGILHNNTPDKLGVAHSFTGTIGEAKKYLELGFYLGLNGIITFTNQHNDLVKYIPLDRMLLETDAPFLAPQSHRGKRNEPIYVLEVAQKIAELREESLEEIIEQTTNNSVKLFNL